MRNLHITSASRALCILSAAQAQQVERLLGGRRLYISLGANQTSGAHLVDSGSESAATVIVC